MRIWDISEPIEPGTAVFPGDTPFSAEKLRTPVFAANAHCKTRRRSILSANFAIDGTPVA